MNGKLLCGCEELVELFNYFKAQEILFLHRGNKTFTEAQLLSFLVWNSPPSPFQDDNEHAVSSKYIFLPKVASTVMTKMGYKLLYNLPLQSELHIFWIQNQFYFLDCMEENIPIL